ERAATASDRAWRARAGAAGAARARIHGAVIDGGRHSIIAVSAEPACVIAPAGAIGARKQHAAAYGAVEHVIVGARKRRADTAPIAGIDCSEGVAVSGFVLFGENQDAWLGLHSRGDERCNGKSGEGVAERHRSSS